MKGKHVSSPEFLLDLADDIVADDINSASAVSMMMSREREFPSKMAALMSGIGVRESARRYVDQALAQEWGTEWSPSSPIPEVVIGAGPHALIYAAIRKQMGVDVVLVDKAKHAGGAFACSEGPSFWLNSRNRPGDLGVPGEGVGLNVLPGCPIQPSMIGGGEYQTNDQMAWVVRTNLAMLGIEVHTGVEVTEIEADEDDDLYGLVTPDGTIVADRVILATGLGEPKRLTPSPSDPRWERVVTFMEFMAMMDSPFPLRGMGRVAVIGAGDSGKATVEALLGQGPSSGMSVSMLDFPSKIDWYGCAYTTKDTWCKANRGRYSRIGMAIGTRVFAKPGRCPYFPVGGYESALLGPTTYDWVIDCTGFTREETISFVGSDYYQVGSKNVARRGREEMAEVYRIGPSANIETTERERETVPALANIGDNAVSLFRYAPLTAAFAANLPTEVVS